MSSLRQRLATSGWAEAAEEASMVRGEPDKRTRDRALLAVYGRVAGDAAFALKYLPSLVSADPTPPYAPTAAFDFMHGDDRRKRDVCSVALRWCTDDFGLPEPHHPEFAVVRRLPELLRALAATGEELHDVPDVRETVVALLCARTSPRVVDALDMSWRDANALLRAQRRRMPVWAPRARSQPATRTYTNDEKQMYDYASASLVLAAFQALEGTRWPSPSCASLDKDRYEPPGPWRLS